MPPVYLPSAEYSARLERLQHRLKEEAMDCFIVTQPDSIYYLTGLVYEPLERPFFMLVKPNTDTPTIFVVPLMEAVHVEEESSIKGSVLSYPEFPCPASSSWPRVLVNCFESDWKSIAIEPDMKTHIKQDIVREAQTHAHLQGMQFFDTRAIDTLRHVKSPAEIAMVEQAARYSELGITTMMSEVYYGVSVLQVYSATKAVARVQLEEVGFNPMTTKHLIGPWNAPFSSQPHGIPHLDARLLDGPIVLLSCVRVHGYSAECERTVFIKAPSKEERELYNVMMEGREAGLSVLGPGVPCAAVDEAVSAVFAKAGLSHRVLHRPGHGIGIGTHEGPFLAAGSHDVLQPGMIISMEPGLYVPDTGGFRHSDTILITKTGYKNLTPHLPVDIPALTAMVGGIKIMPWLRGWVVDRLLRKVPFQ